MTSTTDQSHLDAFYADVAAYDLQPLWTQTSDLLPPSPCPSAVPWLWRWETLRALVERASGLVPIERGGERRVLALANPGLHGLPYATPTLWGAMQIVGPGESAPAHRHTAAAIRFVLEGEGLWTTVDGDACEMRTGDLVLTPSWAFHDHTNHGSVPMVWFDGLDLPLVKALDAVFFEPYKDRLQPVEAKNASESRVAGRALLARGTQVGHDGSPLLVYRWPETDRALDALLAQDGGTVASIEFTNPTTGGPVLPTIGCAMHRLRSTTVTTPWRKTGSSVFVVHRGSGVTVAGSAVLRWSRGDMFVVPSWCPTYHASLEDSDLFELSDEPVLRALRLYREEAVPDARDAAELWSSAVSG